MLNESTPPGLPDSRLGTEPTQPQLQSAAATFALLGSAPRLHLAWRMAHETSYVGTLAPDPEAHCEAVPPRGEARPRGMDGLPVGQEADPGQVLDSAAHLAGVQVVAGDPQARAGGQHVVSA